MGPPAHFLRRHVQHHRRVRHSHLERGAPQDGVRLQPHGPRLPRPWPLGQRPGGAEGSGHHRGGVPTQGLIRDIQHRDTRNRAGVCKHMILVGAGEVHWTDEVISISEKKGQ